MNSIGQTLRYYRTRLLYNLPTTWFFKKRYEKRTGQKLNLDNPVLFNEKLQWLKLNYRHKHLIQLVDKVGVRDFIRERIGEEYLIPIHGVFDSVDQIKLDDLPDRFALKANHGCGWNLLCTDKNKLDWPRSQKMMKSWLRSVYGEDKMEWPYKYVEPKIICEQLLLDEAGRIPMDFKFFCFHGKPELIMVDLDRFTKHTRNIYDTDWNMLKLQFSIYPQSPYILDRPPTLEKMLQAVADLSRDLPFARVDFYSFSQKVYFGEITLFPAGGYQSFNPPEYNRILGDKLTLPPPSRKLKL